MKNVTSVSTSCFIDKENVRTYEYMYIVYAQPISALIIFTYELVEYIVSIITYALLHTNTTNVNVTKKHKLTYYYEIKRTMHKHYFYRNNLNNMATLVMCREHRYMDMRARKNL